MERVDHSEFLSKAGFPAVISSRPQGWRGLVLEHQRQPPSEFEVPALSQHLIILSLGRPVPLMQERGGRAEQGTMVPGEVLVTPAGQPSHWISGGAVNALHLLAAPEFVARTAESVGMTLDQAEIVHNFGTLDPRLEQIGRLLFDEAQTRGLGGRLYADSLVITLTVHLLRHYSASGEVAARRVPGLSEAALRRVVEYVNDNLERDFPLQDLAALAGIAPNALVRQFRRSLGIAPHQYVIKQRVERARQMLLSGTESIGEIASQVGFYDQSHLTRHFKRLLGVTPKRLLSERDR